MVLSAAQDLFARNGYEGTSTRAISSQAGVSLALVFSNFGSKAELFQAAVVQPFADLVESYVMQWATFTERDEVEGAIITRFVWSFYDLARTNRTLLLHAAARRSSADTSTSEVDVVDHFARALKPIQALAANNAQRHGWTFEDPPATFAACMGPILSIALLDDLIFPARTRRPSVARLVTETVNLILYGLANRPKGQDSTAG